MAGSLAGDVPVTQTTVVTRDNTGWCWCQRSATTAAICYPPSGFGPWFPVLWGANAASGAALPVLSSAHRQSGKLGGISDSTIKVYKPGFRPHHASNTPLVSG
jgi:hypothetical protein